MKVALQLLDYQIADEDVRQLGVKRLEELRNDELELYLLQLVQVILHVSAVFLTVVLVC